MDLPIHRDQHTGNAILDRIQANVRDIISYLRNSRVAAPAYVQQAADITITVAAYAKLFEVAIQKVQVGTRLRIHFGASFLQLTNPGGAYFQVKLDGVIQKGTYVSTSVAGTAYNAHLSLIVPAAEGRRIVTVEWKCAVNSLRIAAKTIVEEHATLIVEEIPS